MKDAVRKPQEKVEKGHYTKPVLIKHKQLKDITAGAAGSNINPNPGLGCTRAF